jgi:segregation and condensation protein A
MTGSPPPRVSAGNFEGPLDLLLDEVRRQNVAIEDVELAPLVGRFLAYPRIAKASNLNLDMEWLHMAATLIHWKSRALLPADPATPEAKNDPVRDDLIGQLLAHRKKLAGILAHRKQEEEKEFSRATEKESVEEEEPAFESVWDLLQQARELARWATDQKASRAHWQESMGVTREEATVGEMMDFLRSEFAASAGQPLDGDRLIVRQSAARRVCLILGMLEMARDQQLEILQAEQFGPVWIVQKSA